MVFGKDNPVPESVDVTFTDSDNEDGVLGDAESVEVPHVQASKVDKPLLQEVDIIGVSGSKNAGVQRNGCVSPTIKCLPALILEFMYTFLVLQSGKHQKSKGVLLYSRIGLNIKAC